MDAASVERWESPFRGVHKLSEVRKETNAPGGALAAGKPCITYPVKMMHESRSSCFDLAPMKVDVDAVLWLRSGLGTMIYCRQLSRDSGAAII